MGCPICDNKPANCDCTAKEREQFDEIQSLQSQIARLREERRWVSVGERLPEHPCWVIAFDAEQQLVIYVHFSSDDYDGGPVWENDRGRRNPTHWMPLPPGPKGDGNG
jgi:hypothetical protein